MVLFFYLFSLLTRQSSTIFNIQSSHTGIRYWNWNWNWVIHLFISLFSPDNIYSHTETGILVELGELKVPLIFFFFLSTDPPQNLLSSSCYWFIVFLYFSLHYYSLVLFTWQLGYLFTYHMVTGTELGELQVSLIYFFLFLYFTLFLAYHSRGLFSSCSM